MAVAHEASSAVRLEPAVSETAERLFQEHSGWVYGYCLRLLRSPEEAEDALQATYLNACRSLNDGVEPRVDSAWLLRIAQNVCLTRLRSTGRRAKLERVQDVALLEETVAAPDRRADELIGLADALAVLPDHQRHAILLREWQGLSYAEVGDRLGLTQSAVETLICRARRSHASALENPAKRRRVRLAHAFDVAGLAAALKGWLAGSAAAQVAAAVAVATTTATTVAVTDPAGLWSDRPQKRGETPAAEATAASGRPAVKASAASVAADAARSTQLPHDAAERRHFARSGGTVPQAAGREKAAEAKAGGKGKSAENGKASAPGQAKELAGAPKSSNGKGVPASGKPAATGTPGPPPSAPGQTKEPSQPKGQGQAQEQGSPPPRAVENSAGKAGVKSP